MTLTDFLNQLQTTTDVFTAQDILLTVVLSFVLSLIIARVYQITYRGNSYTQSYVHTLVLMSMVVGVIMLIIGSNIARAFSLVGALSIIRFRNAVKDTRDVGFIFFAMAVGMACGTRFYLVAVVSTFLISGLMLVLVRLNMFAGVVQRHLLKIRVAADLPYGQLLAPAFDRFLRHYDLVAMETVQAGTLTELVYSVELKAEDDAQTFLAELSRINDNNKVVLITGQQEVDL